MNLMVNREADLYYNVRISYIHILLYCYIIDGTIAIYSFTLLKRDETHTFFIVDLFRMNDLKEEMDEYYYRTPVLSKSTVPFDHYLFVLLHSGARYDTLTQSRSIFRQKVKDKEPQCLSEE